MGTQLLSLIFYPIWGVAILYVWSIFPRTIFNLIRFFALGPLPLHITYVMAWFLPFYNPCTSLCEFFLGSLWKHKCICISSLITNIYHTHPFKVHLKILLPPPLFPYVPFATFALVHEMRNHVNRTTFAFFQVLHSGIRVLLWVAFLVAITDSSCKTFHWCAGQVALPFSSILCTPIWRRRGWLTPRTSFFQTTRQFSPLFTMPSLSRYQPPRNR